MFRFLSSTTLFFFSLSTAFSQNVRLSGTIRDAVSGQGLPAANIRVLGTSWGTIANRNGDFVLSLPGRQYRILFSYIGYQSDTATVNLDKDRVLHIKLSPSPVQLADVVVTPEDPSVGIMRRVIDRKHQWIDALDAYEFDAYTKEVFRNDTAILQMRESHGTGYWKKGKYVQVYIRQKRQTENIRFNFGGANTEMYNFYDDEIQMQSFRFIGPTSREAFDYYDFKLVRTSKRGDVPIYVIRMIPKSRTTPLFRGTISIIGDTYAVVGIEVTPNEAFILPIEYTGEYSQQFDLYEDKFWLPKDIRQTQKFRASMFGFTLSGAVENYTSIYGYRINGSMSDTIFAHPNEGLFATGEKYDSVYWEQREVLPLTAEEKKAYVTLDSTQTLDKQLLSPEVRTAASTAKFFSGVWNILKHVNIRHDRVEGLNLGANVDLTIKENVLDAFGSAAYGFSDKKAKFGLGTRIFLSGYGPYPAITPENRDSVVALRNSTRVSFELEGYDDLRRISDWGFYPPIVVGAGSLLFKEDQGDYYYARGFNAILRTNFTNGLRTSLQYTREDQKSAVVTTDYSLFNKGRHFRANPAILEGRMASVALRAHIGEDENMLGLNTPKFFELELEHSSPQLLDSDFDFSRVVAKASYNINTFSQRMWSPQSLRARITAGTSFGTLPPQRQFALESPYMFYGPFGILRTSGVKEFSGDKFVMLSLEHNFRSIPFLFLDIPFLYRNSIEVIAHGTFARTWSSSAIPALGVPTKGWYMEAGLGLSKIYYALRLDVSYRFADPRGLYITIALSPYDIK